MNVGFIEMENGWVKGRQAINKPLGWLGEDRAKYIKRFRQSPGGKTAIYIALAHNTIEHWAGGKSQTRPHLTKLFGREDSTTPQALDDLVTMITVLYERRIKASKTQIETVEDVSAGLRISARTRTWSRSDNSELQFCRTSGPQWREPLFFDEIRLNARLMGEGPTVSKTRYGAIRRRLPNLDSVHQCMPCSRRRNGAGSLLTSVASDASKPGKYVFQGLETGRTG